MVQVHLHDLGLMIRNEFGGVRLELLDLAVGDHLFVDRRILPDLFFEISLCDKEADQCANDSAGNKPAQCIVLAIKGR